MLSCRFHLLLTETVVSFLSPYLSSVILLRKHRLTRLLLANFGCYNSTYLLSQMLHLVPVHLYRKHSQHVRLSPLFHGTDMILRWERTGGGEPVTGRRSPIRGGQGRRVGRRLVWRGRRWRRIHRLSVCGARTTRDVHCFVSVTIDHTQPSS